MKNRPKTLVIIPAYSEEGAMGNVVEGVKQYLPGARVLVVNDGSSDHTSQKAEASSAIVLNLPFNLGMGGAKQAGYHYAIKKGYEVAFQVDGDGQYDPKEPPFGPKCLRPYLPLLKLEKECWFR